MWLVAVASAAPPTPEGAEVCDLPRDPVCPVDCVGGWPVFVPDCDRSYPTGTATVWYPDGQVALRGPVEPEVGRPGRRATGEWRRWDEDGTLLDVETVTAGEPAGGSVLARLLRSWQSPTMHHRGPLPPVSRAAQPPGFAIEVQLLADRLIWEETTYLPPTAFGPLRREMARTYRRYRAMALWRYPPANPSAKRALLLAVPERPWADVHQALVALQRVEVRQVGLEVHDPAVRFPDAAANRVNSGWEPLFTIDVTLGDAERGDTVVQLGPSALAVSGPAQSEVFAWSTDLGRPLLPPELPSLLREHAAAGGALVVEIPPAPTSPSWDVVVGLLDAALDERGFPAFSEIRLAVAR